MYPSYLALKDSGEAIVFLGIPVKLATYSASVVPILLVVWAGIKSWADATAGLTALPVYIGGEGMSNFFNAIMMVIICSVVKFIVAYILGGKYAKEEVKKCLIIKIYLYQYLNKERII